MPFSEDQESFTITVYNIFTKTYLLIIDLTTVKQIYKYFIDNHIPIKEDTFRNIAVEFHNENIQVVEFDKFKYFMCKTLSIDFIDDRDELIYELDTLKIYSTIRTNDDTFKIYSTSCNRDDHATNPHENKIKSYKLIEVKNHLKSFLPKNEKSIFCVICQIEILSNGTYNMFDSTESLNISEDNFVLSSYNEIRGRCIEGCSYAMQLSFIEDNGKIKLNAIIFPYLVNNLKIYKKVSFINDHDFKEEYITINALKTKTFNIVTKHFLKGSLLKQNESIFCSDGNSNLFVSRFNILELSPYTQMKAVYEAKRLDFFIENFTLKCLLKLVSENQKKLREGKINWIILCKEIELTFDFTFFLNNKEYTINAFCINDNFKYKFCLKEKLMIKKEEIVSFFE